MLIFRPFACLLFGLCLASVPLAAANHVASTGYAWEDLTDPTAANRIITRRFFAGESTLLKEVRLTATRLPPGKTAHEPRILTNTEQLILVKEGELSVTLGEHLHRIGPASVALILPGELHLLINASGAPVTFYTLSYESKTPPDPERGAAAGGSLVVDFNDLEFRPHDRGGLRNYFDRGTTMTENFEMHVTTLNEGITSHPPHTHRSEEIILMIHGEAEELINGEPHALATGDLAFLDSMVPHGIRNTGAGACMYFAFQWR